MSGWFEISSESGRGLLLLTMGGFFGGEDIARMRVGLIDAVTKLGLAPNQHLTLCDITAMSIQSQEMVTRFTGLVGSPEVRSRRLAFVTGATLARHQAMRLTDRADVQFFSERPAALAWLNGAPMPPAWLPQPHSTQSSPMSR